MIIAVTILSCAFVVNAVACLFVLLRVLKLQRQILIWEGVVAAWGQGVERLTVNTAEMLRRVGDIVSLKVQ